MTYNNDKADLSSLYGFYLCPSIRQESFVHTDKIVSSNSSLSFSEGEITSVSDKESYSSHKYKPWKSSESVSKPIVSCKKHALNLQQVLDIIQQAWTNPQELYSAEKVRMEERLKKTNPASSTNQSPIFIRRRLSAPEIIMRKHTLALQLSESLDTYNYSKKNRWKNDLDGGSDSNLNRRKDIDYIRKSSLLKRLWSNTKSYSYSRFSRSFYEWQSEKTSSSPQSLTSLHSSPEHFRSRRSLNNLSQDRNNSPKHQVFNNPIISRNSQHFSNNSKKTMSYHDNNNFDRFSISSYNDLTPTKSTFQNSNTTTPKTIGDTCTIDNTNYFSDSVCTNDNSNCSNNNSISTEIIPEDQISNQLEEKRMEQEHFKNTDFLKYTNMKESAQTSSSSNINVISNVQLSQSTLDLIYNHVMQDIGYKTVDKDNNIVNNKICSDSTEVPQIPSFYLQHKENLNDLKNKQIVKYMIGNIASGSPYSTKSFEIPQAVVPRLSALPRTTSMEVNTSSGGESTDKESDNISLTDSLEESGIKSSKPKDFKGNKSDDLAILLPDNSSKKITPASTTFFIPIQKNEQIELKTMSDHLPEKVKNKLIKRQQKREDRIKNKRNSSKSDSNYVTASDHSNQNLYDNADSNSSFRLPEINSRKVINKIRKTKKTILPNIKTFQKIKDEKPCNQSTSRKNDRLPQNQVSSSSSDNRSKREFLTLSKDTSKLEPLISSKCEASNCPKNNQVYQKSSLQNISKRIEILEIMECIETPRREQIVKNKSKIPILINRLPKLNFQNTKIIKPTFLEVTRTDISDPKIDQLIANILISTLNSSPLESNSLKCDKSVKTSPPPIQTNSKYQHKTNVIAEETIDHQQNNKERNNNDEVKNQAQGENSTTIPKGWITFYMLHKNEESPDSTSDEGKNTRSKHKEYIQQIRNSNKAENTSNNTNDKHFYGDMDFDNINGRKTPPKKAWLPRNRRFKRIKQKDKINSSKYQERSNINAGSWSITVSGTTNCEQLAPNMEMYLKFPQSKNLPTEQKDNIIFPKIETKRNDNRDNEETGTFYYSNQKLPQIAHPKQRVNRKY